MLAVSVLVPAAAHPLHARAYCSIKPSETITFDNSDALRARVVVALGRPKTKFYEALGHQRM